MAPRALSITAAAALAFSSPALSETLYVNGSLTTGADDGSSWDNAFRGPGALVNAVAATVDGDQLYIAQGRYLVTDRDRREDRISLDYEVSFYGGFLGNEESLFERPAAGAAPTILSGDIAGDDGHPSGSRSDNSRWLMNLQEVTNGVLDRLVFEGAFNNDFGSGNSMAALAIRFGAAPTIRDCVFRNNECYGSGAAILSDRGRFRVQDCVFEGNRARYGSGGAIFAQLNGQGDYIDRCEFIDNVGAGAGSIAFNRFIFGASSGAIDVTNCLFRGNITSAVGAVGTIATGSNANGGTFRFTNCTVTDNETLGRETVGIVRLSGTVEVTNCIVAGNRSFGGTTGGKEELSGNMTVTSSIVEGGYPGGTNVIDAVPIFEDPAQGNFMLALQSPGIDAGLNAALGSGRGSFADLRGKRRAHDEPSVPNTGVGFDGAIDLGAIERIDMLGRIFCRGLANSTAFVGRTSAEGSLSLAAADLTLAVKNLPPSVTGFFVTSRVSREPFNPSGSNGELCLGGLIGRLLAPGQVFQTSSSGDAALVVDTATLPTAMGTVPVLAGQTWHFQAWHRDAVIGLPTAGFTEGLALTFEP